MNKLLVSALSCVLLSACSAPAVKDSAIIQQSAMEQAKTVSLSPQQVLDETRDLQVLAQREDLYFYSPTYIAQAENEIRQAEEAFKEKLEPQQIITHALAGQQLLKRGLETKQTVLTQLKLALDGLAMLTELKAEKLMASEFSDVQGNTKELIILVEQGNTSQALKEQSDVLKEIAQLEIEVLKKTYLSQAEMALEKAEDTDAEDYASVSFEQASVAVERLKSFIETNPKKRQDINLKTQDTVRLCQHAQNVASAAKPLLDLTPESAEQHVLFIEKLIARIGNALKHEDVSYLPLDNQSIALAQAAETINKQAQSIKQQGQWETEKAELQAKLTQLQEQLNTATQASVIEEPLVNEPSSETPTGSASLESTAVAETAPQPTDSAQQKDLTAPTSPEELSKEQAVENGTQQEGDSLAEQASNESNAPEEAPQEPVQESTTNQATSVKTEKSPEIIEEVIEQNEADQETNEPVTEQASETESPATVEVSVQETTTDAIEVESTSNEAATQSEGIQSETETP